ncbi:orotate phosphoribosyltransferase [Candidatus Endowatersipora endosymbiont of Watersipora subatra]|uniref:orotate phosphoribosyltransferase n=1 Tax=Candidatus Endowatersipora endosymbiont of Watersipora subatra TaxID=3077946 RepID=UPI00312C789E
MIENKAKNKAMIALKTAKMLLEIKAVNFRSKEPYTFTSGLKSPVYIDCRKLISYPRIRSAVSDFCVVTVMRDVDFEKYDVVAGGETAGIPYAAFIAERMRLPMIYIRKKSKGFGRNVRIEGDLKAGQHVLFVEDLTTDGTSKLSFAQAIREAGAIVSDILCVFYYDIFRHAPTLLAQYGIKLHYLTTWKDVLSVARNEALFDPLTLYEVKKFLDSPLEWSASHGGISDFRYKPR